MVEKRKGHRKKSEIAMVQLPHFMAEQGRSHEPVYINPSENEARRFIRDNSNFARVMRDDEGNVYLWNADHAIHDHIRAGLGIKAPRDEWGLVPSWILSHSDLWTTGKGRLRAVTGEDMEPTDRDYQRPLEWLKGPREDVGHAFGGRARRRHGGRR